MELEQGVITKRIAAGSELPFHCEQQTGLRRCQR
jgi:hypothetical protein